MIMLCCCCGSGGGVLLLLLLLVAQRTRNIPVYLRNEYAKTTVRAATLRQIADQTFYLTQSQNTDTGPTSRSADPVTPGIGLGNH